MTDVIDRALAEQLSRRSLLKGGAALVGTGGLASLLAACQTSTNTNPSAASAGLVGNGEKYPVVIFLTTLSYWDMHFKGFADIGKALNVSFDKLGPTNADVAAEATALEQAIGQNVKGIVVGAVDDQVIGKSINKAIDAGIPVVTMDAGSLSSKAPYVGTDNAAAGYLCGKRLIADIGGSGKILLTTTTIAGVAKVQRVAAFKQAVAETNGAVQIVATVNDGDTAEVAVKSVGQALQAYPDVKGIMTISAGAGLGTVKAIQESGRKDIHAGVFANDQDVFKAAKNGGLFVAAQDGYRMGLICGLFIHLAAKGIMKPNYNPKALGGRSVLPPNTDSGLHLVDASNADYFIQ